MQSAIKNNRSLSKLDEKVISENYSIEVKESIFYNVFTRFFDLIAALLGLIITFPVIIMFIVLIKLEDKGPSFYKQERLGKDGKIFWVYKLRSMRMDAEKFGIQWAEKNDPRITKVGKFIRKTRIDELPQLINILVGDMKLIGPRPERPELTLQFNEENPGFTNRLIVKPGLTGWAQVNGGYDMTPKEKLELDIYYIHNRNLKLDFIVILKTIAVVITGDGAR